MTERVDEQLAEERVTAESVGRVLLITMRRPERRNAVDAAMTAGLEAAVDRLEEDPDLWIGVLTGEGPAFCAGADLVAVAGGAADGIMTRRGGFGGLTRRERAKPLIAAVEGPAVAGGLELVLACDLVVASSAASFGLPEVKRSLLAYAGGTTRLPKRVPLNLAMELVLTGDPIDATRAYELGLVNQLCEPGSAVTSAVAMAERIAENAPLAVRESRLAVLDSLGLDDAEAMRRAARRSAALAGTEDSKEGPLAFVEKRPPRWTGR
ncbi:MAG: crotonase/enoyl-CoA hydratase family protein [Acidimicrobiales bacterium]|nr:crotonase/enoyl-CoA hydratase family protein [Acidimicrobiales bacterium]